MKQTSINILFIQRSTSDQHQNNKIINIMQRSGAAGSFRQEVSV